MYQLNEEEKERLIRGIQAAYAIPFIHDITDYIWEAIFAYAKNVAAVDPLENTRSKSLFDVVDTKIPSTGNSIGWSAKAIQLDTNLIRPRILQLVIQRSDIFKKSRELGFDQLSLDSPTDILGRALLIHWQMKIKTDAINQRVSDKRICLLVKSKNRKNYYYYEDSIATYLPDELEWKWTTEQKIGLQGIRKTDSRVIYTWYRNQTQFFESFILPEGTLSFNLQPYRLPLAETVDMLVSRLGTSGYLQQR
jgi:hypothetical protein